MKVIKSKEAQKFVRSNSCTVWEYEMADKDINIATAKISGRHPEQGFSINTRCKELVFVLGGEGKMIFENQEIKLEKGDSVLIEPNEKFYLEGNLEISISCNPAWTLEQYKSVE